MRSNSRASGSRWSASGTEVADPRVTVSGERPQDAEGDLTADLRSPALSHALRRLAVHGSEGHHSQPVDFNRSSRLPGRGAVRQGGVLPVALGRFSLPRSDRVWRSHSGPARLRGIEGCWHRLRLRWGPDLSPRVVGLNPQGWEDDHNELPPESWRVGLGCVG